MRPRYLYHWTMRLSVASIRATGLDPAYATGKRVVVWLTTRDRVMWGCAHAAMHQRCAPDDMVLLRVRVAGLVLGRTAWAGVRTSSETISPDRIEVCTLTPAPVSARTHTTRRRRRKANARA